MRITLTCRVLWVLILGAVFRVADVREEVPYAFLLIEYLCLFIDKVNGEKRVIGEKRVS